jgi:ABC-type Fe3+-hydroxamate transport system substrate-binding protein
VRRVTDQTDRSVRVGERPRRIVSLVPSQTELLFDLGLDEEIVGVTRFCVHPAKRVAGKAIVGGTRDPDVEAIERLRPDLVIGAREENDRETLLGLAESYPVWASDVRSLAGALEMIRSVGDLVGRAGPADRLAGEIEAGFASLRPLSPARRAAYVVWPRPLMVAGRDTFIDDLLARCGLTNAAGHAEGARYPEVTVEGLRAAGLDVLLLASEPYPFEEADREAWEGRLPGVPVHLVNGEMFSWYGSRLLKAVGYLERLIGRLTVAGD